MITTANTTTLSLNKYEFNYVEKGSGEKIIFIHGSASDRRTWNKTIDTLAEDYQTIAYSRRYHWPNKKINNGADYSMQQHVDDLKAIIQFLGDEPVNLVGHSYGALMAIELACHHPELIHKMILSEPPAIRLFVSNIPKPSELLRLLFNKPKTALSIIKLGATGLGPATKAAEAGDMEKAMRLFGKAALGKRTFKNMSAERREQALVNLTTAEFTGSGFLSLDAEELEAIQIPTLLLNGALSPKIYHHLADSLGELLPNLQRTTITKASHIIHEDNLGAYCTALRNFLSN